MQARNSHSQANSSSFFKANKKGLGCCSAILAIPLILFIVFIVVNNLPADLSLEAAHYDTEKWVGREVRLQGWLRLFEGSSGPHFAIEDEQQNRVVVREYDQDFLKPLIGCLVKLEGKFDFNESYGLYLTVHSLIKLTATGLKCSRARLVAIT